MRIPTASVDRYVYFVAVDSTDLKTRETALTTFTVYYSLQGAAAVAMTTPTVNETDQTNMPGVYELLIDESGMTTLTAGHDTEELVLHITQASMAPVTRAIEIHRPEVTQGNTLDVTAGGNAGIDLDNTAGTLDAAEIATGAITAAKFAAGAIDAAAIAANAIGASELATDAVAEIADGVWDEDATGHQTGGTFGQAIGDPVADTTTIYQAVVTDAAGTHIAADIIAIEGQTDDIGVAGVGLTALPWNGAVWDAEVQSEAADALTAYDPPTRAELTSDIGTLPTALTNADAVWDEDATGHQTGGTFGQAIGDPVADTMTIFKAVATDAAGTSIAADIIAIEDQTDDIGVAGVGLTAVVWNANWDAEVQSEVADALAVYDPPTRAELSTDIATLPTAAAVNAEVVDALTTDTYGEPSQAAPGATATLEDKISYLYNALIGRVDVTATEKEFHNDALTVIWKKALSDDGTTYTEGEGATGP